MIQKIYKRALSFYRSIKGGNITLEKAAQPHKEFQSELSEIVKGNKKLEDQKSAINNIKTLYEPRERVTKFFDD